MSRRDSLFTRSLEPLVGSLWFLFVFWTIFVAALWVSGIDREQVSTHVNNFGLRDALVLILKAADAIWLILAFTNLYLELATRLGLREARLWTFTVLLAGSVVAITSSRLGWPLGSVTFTARMGWKLGPVPLGWPLWWFVVVIGGRALAARAFPRGSHRQIAIATGAIALLTTINLEPLASKVRLFWFWYRPGTHLAGQAGWANYATWCLLATMLSFFLRERNIAATPVSSSWRPALVLILFNAVFLLTHLAETIRR